MESTEITIENIGPVLSHKLALIPGVTVLTGQNEVGKSTCIAAVSALMGGEQEVSVRDGAKSGMVRGCGAVLSVSRRRSRAGVLEADSTDSKIDISVLVDPPYKQPESAMKARIKALLGLTGATIKPEAFADIAPPDVVASCQDDDPVEFARKLKAKLEKMARDYESARDKCEGESSALTQQIAAVDCSGESDPKILQDAVVLASREEATLIEKRNTYDRQKLRVMEARAKVNDIRAGITVDLAALHEQICGVKANIADADSSLKYAQEAEAKAKKALDDATAAVKAVNDRRKALEATLDSLIAQEDSVGAAEQEIKELQDVMDSPLQAPPSAEEIAAAANAITAAREAVERGAAIRAAKENLVKRDQKLQQAADNASAALQMRQSASGTDDVLSEAVSCETLKVVAGELIYCEGSRQEPYSRLSDGKRWQIAIREVARAFHANNRDRPCILTVPQYAWGELDEENKRVVHAAALEAKVSIVTAETGEGELSSFWFGDRILNERAEG